MSMRIMSFAVPRSLSAIAVQKQANLLGDSRIFSRSEVNKIALAKTVDYALFLSTSCHCSSNRSCAPTAQRKRCRGCSRGSAARNLRFSPLIHKPIRSVPVRADRTDPYGTDDSQGPRVFFSFDMTSDLLSTVLVFRFGTSRYSSCGR